MNDVLSNSGLSGTANVVIADVVDGLVYNENCVVTPTETCQDVTESANSMDQFHQDIAGNPSMITAGGKTIDQLRAEKMADVVIVVGSVPASTGGGRANALTNINGNYTNYIIVADVDTTITADHVLTWIHELAHLAGITHEDQTNGVSPSGRGYIQNNAVGNPAYGDVMARATDQGVVVCWPSGAQSNGCERARFFSDGDPNKSYVANDGITYPRGDAQHNAVGTLLQTLSKLAQYYESIPAPPPPPPPPAIAFLEAHFLGCPPGCGLSPYRIYWWGQNATSYEVQHHGGYYWSPYYSGPNSEVMASTGTSYGELFRVRALNASGASAWIQIGISPQCSPNDNPY